MKVGIVGAGFTGLSAAYRLLESGCEVEIFERDSKPGGLAVGFSRNNWKWTLERHYHHFFTNDDSILNLAREINHKIIVKRPKTSVYAKREIHQLDSPMNVLKYPLLSPIDRLRMSAVLAVLKFNPYWRIFEPYLASDVLPRVMGPRAYNLLWDGQMKGKFGEYADKISLAWFWARVYKRTSSLAYPEGGFLKLAERLSESITEQGGKTHYANDVVSIEENKNGAIVEVAKNGRIKKHVFDKVIVTLPSRPFMNVAKGLNNKYKKQLSKLEGIGAINVVLRLSERFFDNNTYWLSVCDKKFPFMAVVEHTNFMSPRHYGGERLVYVGKYLSPNHKYFKLSDKELFRTYDPFLEKLSKGYKKNMLGYEVFRAPFAQPIIPPNYSKIKPKFETPIKNVFLANIQQVYPWDRGTNYAVELGESVTRYLLEQK